MTNLTYKYGFTLVEILIAVTIIGMLAAFIIPEIVMSLRSRENAECSRKLRTAVQAFELFSQETGGYPADRSPGVIPPEMADYYFPYFKIDWWGNATELGGRWDWDAGYHGFKFSVSICNPARSREQMDELDRMIDDGNLGSGSFRQVGTQYHYIIED
jgi:prepilin-type N-terminal cleavage/methylation domain-containing protein